MLKINKKILLFFLLWLGISINIFAMKRTLEGADDSPLKRQKIESNLALSNLGIGTIIYNIGKDLDVADFVALSRVSKEYFQHYYFDPIYNFTNRVAKKKAPFFPSPKKNYADTEEEALIHLFNDKYVSPLAHVKRQSTEELQHFWTKHPLLFDVYDRLRDRSARSLRFAPQKLSHQLEIFFDHFANMASELENNQVFLMAPEAMSKLQLFDRTRKAIKIVKNNLSSLTENDREFLFSNSQSLLGAALKGSNTYGSALDSFDFLTNELEKFRAQFMAKASTHRHADLVARLDKLLAFLEVDDEIFLSFNEVHEFLQKWSGFIADATGAPSVDHDIARYFRGDHLHHLRNNITVLCDVFISLCFTLIDDDISGFHNQEPKSKIEFLLFVKLHTEKFLNGVAVKSLPYAQMQAQVDLLQALIFRQLADLELNINEDSTPHEMSSYESREILYTKAKELFIKVQNNPYSHGSMKMRAIFSLLEMESLLQGQSKIIEYKKYDYNYLISNKMTPPSIKAKAQWKIFRIGVNHPDKVPNFNQWLTKNRLTTIVNDKLLSAMLDHLQDIIGKRPATGYKASFSAQGIPPAHPGAVADDTEPSALHSTAPEKSGDFYDQQAPRELGNISAFFLDEVSEENDSEMAAYCKEAGIPYHPSKKNRQTKEDDDFAMTPLTFGGLEPELSYLICNENGNITAVTTTESALTESEINHSKAIWGKEHFIISKYLELKIYHDMANILFYQADDFITFQDEQTLASLELLRQRTNNRIQAIADENEKQSLLLGVPQRGVYNPLALMAFNDQLVSLRQEMQLSASSNDEFVSPFLNDPNWENFFRRLSQRFPDEFAPYSNAITFIRDINRCAKAVFFKLKEEYNKLLKEPSLPKIYKIKINNILVKMDARGQGNHIYAKAIPLRERMLTLRRHYEGMLQKARDEEAMKLRYKLAEMDRLGQGMIYEREIDLAFLSPKKLQEKFIIIKEDPHTNPYTRLKAKFSLLEMHRIGQIKNSYMDPASLLEEYRILLQNESCKADLEVKINLAMADIFYQNKDYHHAFSIYHSVISTPAVTKELKWQADEAIARMIFQNHDQCIPSAVRQRYSQRIEESLNILHKAITDNLSEKMEKIWSASLRLEPINNLYSYDELIVLRKKLSKLDNNPAILSFLKGKLRLMLALLAFHGYNELAANSSATYHMLEQIIIGSDATIQQRACARLLLAQLCLTGTFKNLEMAQELLQSFSDSMQLTKFDNILLDLYQKIAAALATAKLGNR